MDLLVMHPHRIGCVDGEGYVKLGSKQLGFAGDLTHLVVGDGVLPAAEGLKDRCNVGVLVGCSTNLASWQGSVFGFPNPFIGMMAWPVVITIGVAVLAGAQFARWFWIGFNVGVLGAIVFVGWLIAQSIYVLDVLCPWCMLTWSVTIPTFFATMVHLGRNGTFSRSERVKSTASKLMAWVPLATILAYAVVILLAQLRGLDILGEVVGMIF